MAVGQAENLRNAGESCATGTKAGIFPCIVYNAVLKEGMVTGYVTSQLIITEVMVLSTSVIKSSGCKTLILLQYLFLCFKKQDAQLPFPTFT